MRDSSLLLGLALGGSLLGGCASTQQTDAVLGVAAFADGSVAAVAKRTSFTIDPTFDEGDMVSTNSSTLSAVLLDPSGEKRWATRIAGTTSLGLVALDDGTVLAQTDATDTPVVHLDADGYVVATTSFPSCGVGLQRNGGGVWLGAHDAPLCKLDTSGVVPTATPAFAWTPSGDQSSLADSRVLTDGSLVALVTDSDGTGTLQRWNAQGVALPDLALEGSPVVVREAAAGEAAVFFDQDTIDETGRTEYDLVRQVVDATNVPVSSTSTTGTLGGVATFDADGASLLGTFTVGINPWTTGLGADGSVRYQLVLFDGTSGVTDVESYPNGGHVAAGPLASPTSSDVGDLDAAVIALDVSGNVLWQATAHSW